MFLSKKHTDTSRFKAVFKKKISLSTYFPSGTQFYYGYPAGEDSGFLNGDTSPKTSELFAARAYSCAGSKVSVVGYASSRYPVIPQGVFDKLCVPNLLSSQAIILPKKITSSYETHVRNKLIKKALMKTISPGMLVMAQPFIDESMSEIFQIPSQLTFWLNDKNNMRDYIMEALLPKRHGTYRNGLEFEKEYKKLSLPVVIKASSSAGGDGVFICSTKADLLNAVSKLSSISGTILAEQYIKDIKNYAIHFGIPADGRRPIDILGVNEQLTTPDGEFVGGIIRSTTIPKVLEQSVAHLREVILPHVRSMGWHGIGGFDVLIDEKGLAYYIDCNFRMTGMSAYHFMVANNEITEPLVAITGRFNGGSEEFESTMYPYAGSKSSDRFLQIVAMTRHKDAWQFNASLSFSSEAELMTRARMLLGCGVESHALRLISKGI